jgi:uncharacterized protein (TIGR02118 family)
MFQLTVLYGQPHEPAGFDRHYQEIHVPLAKKIPGMQGYTIFKPALLDPQGQSPYYLIADLYFESAEALQAGLQSPEGQAAAADLPGFATGGATLLVGEVQVLTPVTIR